MKNFIVAGVILLGIAAAGAHPVRAECNASERFIEAASLQGNESMSGGDVADGGGDSAVTDGNPDRSEGGGAETGVETSTDTVTGVDAVKPDVRTEENGESGEGESGGGEGEEGEEASSQGLSNDEVTADFVVTVPAEVELAEDAENNKIIGAVSVTVQYLRQMDNFSLHFDESSFVMRDRQSGRTLPLKGWLEDGAWEDGGYGGYSSKLWLNGERLAGDWVGTVRLAISAHG